MIESKNFNQTIEFPSSPEGMPGYLDLSFDVATGNFWCKPEWRGNRVLPQIEYLSGPASDRGAVVVDVETEFATQDDDDNYNLEEYGKNQALRVLSMLDLELLLSELGDPYLKMAIDIGTGPGRIARWLTMRGLERLTVQDPVPRYIEITRNAFDDMPFAPLDLRFLVTPVEAYLENNGFGDPKPDIAIAMFGSLNHADDTLEATTGLYDRLEPGGKLIATFYGTNKAPVFANKLEYDAAILQQRVNGGILLGSDGKKLPTNFSTPVEIVSVLLERGAKIKRLVPQIFLVSAFPKQPTPDSIAAFLDLTADAAGNKVKEELSKFRSNPVALLWRACLWERENIDTIDPSQGAYFAISAQKPSEADDEDEDEV